MNWVCGGCIELLVGCLEFGFVVVVLMLFGRVEMFLDLEDEGVVLVFVFFCKGKWYNLIS